MFGVSQFAGAYAGQSYAEILAGVVVELDLNAPGAGSSNWVDLTTRVADVACNNLRGRQHELDQAQAAEYVITLDNSDGALTPNNTSSIYYPNILPGRRIRARVPGGRSDGSDAILFTLYIEEWPPEWDGPEYGQIQVRATDGISALGAKYLIGSFGAELSGARINAGLDALSWPSGDRSVSTGASTIVATTYAASDKEQALSHFQDVVNTENGQLFADGGGAIVFLDRHTAIKAPYTTSQHTFADGDYERDSGQTLFSFDWQLVYNDVHTTDKDGGAYSASDATSQENYWPRTLSRDLLIAGGTTEGQDAADFLLAAHKDPQLRLPQMVIKPALDNALKQQAMDREVGDRITVVMTPSAGDAIELDFIIEGIGHDIVPAGDVPDWTTTFALAPAGTAGAGVEWWIFDSTRFDAQAFAY